MTTIPTAGRVFWPSTNASIPSGWSEDTDFADRYLEGAAPAADPGTNGGSANHTHTADGHTHEDNHTHQLNILGTASGTVGVQQDKISGVTVATNSHAHVAVNTAVSDKDLQSTAVTIATATADPVHTRLIVIKPDAGGEAIPDDCIVLWDGKGNMPAGFEVADGTGGTTIDLTGDFIKAATNGGDGGGTGGAATHSHTTTAHTHTQASHSHPTSPFGEANNWTVSTISPFALIVVASPRDHHSASGIVSQSVTFNTQAPGTDSISNDPPHTTLIPIQNTSGADASVSAGVMIPYTGTLASITSPWLLIDGSSGMPDTQSRQVKLVATAPEVGNPAGSLNSHTHQGDSHSHTASGSHNHAYTFTSGSTNAATPGATVASQGSHTHSSNSMGTTTPTSTTNGFTMDSVDGRQSYRSVLFLRYEAPPLIHVKGADILGSINIL